jgi:hypothetical protein
MSAYKRAVAFRDFLRFMFYDVTLHKRGGGLVELVVTLDDGKRAIFAFSDAGATVRPAAVQNAGKRLVARSSGIL